jgi:xanthine/CO dehydrogenase XdhC/CoxF family maturation factor
MKEIKAIINAYHKLDFTQNKAALATVVRVEGSSYRRTGARMLITDSGEWIGGISGGCLEGDALKRARLAMVQNKPTLVTYDTTDDDPFQIGVGLGCNGIIDVILTPIDAQNSQNQVLMLQDFVESRTTNVLITVTEVKATHPTIALGDTFRVDTTLSLNPPFPSEEITESLKTDLSFCLQNEKSATVEYATAFGKVKLFIEILPPAIHLLLYGSNYDIYPMVKLAKEIGWKVSVVCNPLKMHKSLVEMADAVLEKEKGTQINIDSYTVALLMAHDYETDYANLSYLLTTDIKYIGMLGPKKRTQKMFDDKQAMGTPITAIDLERIASPVGLDIGASTPEEIAISIIAEIKTVFTTRNGGRLKFREKPIYEV